MMKTELHKYSRKISVLALTPTISIIFVPDLGLAIYLLHAAVVQNELSSIILRQRPCKYILLYLQVCLLKKLPSTAPFLEGAYYCLFSGAVATDLLTESCLLSFS